MKSKRNLHEVRKLQKLAGILKEGYRDYGGTDPFEPDGGDVSDYDYESAIDGIKEVFEQYQKNRVEDGEKPLDEKEYKAKYEEAVDIVERMMYSSLGAFQSDDDAYKYLYNKHLRVHKGEDPSYSSLGRDVAESVLGV